MNTTASNAPAATPVTPTLRDMRPGEESALYRVGARSFSLVERLGASKPKAAVVAEVNGEVAGAVFLKTFKGKGGGKVGYLELGFVTPEHRGMGMGNLLYPAAIKRMRGEGCGVVCAQVKDDNVASWGLLKKNGFSIAGYGGMVRLFGFWRALIISVLTIHCAACGMDFWVDKPRPTRSTGAELAVYLLMNTLIMAPRALRLALERDTGAGLAALAALAAVPAMLALTAFAGLLGTLPTPELGWRFRVVRGGLLLSLLLCAVGTFFPVMGRWYPDSYQNTKPFRRAMGVEALVVWLCCLGLAVAGAYFYLGVPFWRYAGSYSMDLLFYQLLAFFPFAHFGGVRVWQWSKPVFVVLGLVTLPVIFWLF